VFDFAIGGKVLRELLLRNNSNRGVATKQNRPRRGRALIDGENVSGHGFFPERRSASGASALLAAGSPRGQAFFRNRNAHLPQPALA
jgi:hypothetical protein